jgi:hypothetical protein
MGFDHISRSFNDRRADYIQRDKSILCPECQGRGWVTVAAPAGPELRACDSCRTPDGASPKPNH